MRLEIKSMLPYVFIKDAHAIKFLIKNRNKPLTLDQIEDMELNLTDIIKQLQDYRMRHNHE